MQVSPEIAGSNQASLPAEAKKGAMTREAIGFGTSLRLEYFDISFCKNYRLMQGFVKWKSGRGTGRSSLKETVSDDIEGQFCAIVRESWSQL